MDSPVVRYCSFARSLVEKHRVPHCFTHMNVMSWDNGPILHTASMSARRLNITCSPQLLAI